MPNWCENTLSITAKKDDLYKILSVIARPNNNGVPVEDDSFEFKFEDLDALELNILHNLYPTPPDLLIGDAPMGAKTPQQIANKEKYGYTDWYEWRIAHWGTKWSESDLTIREFPIVNDDESPMTIAFYFETAWAPPIEAFNKISIDWPKVLFCLYYEEPGMGFCGKNVWANGECVLEEEAELVHNYFEEDYLFQEHINN